MKNISLAILCIVTAILVSSGSFARDLTYKFGVGYKQIYTNGFVDDTTKAMGAPQQLNALQFSYGLAKDFQVGAVFGFQRDFDAFMAGPSIRYDLQRLIYRDAFLWDYLNIFTQAAFLLKSGGDVKTGLTLHLPYIGFEIMPFKEVNFAIESSAGLTIDLLEKSALGFTNSMFGDVGLRFYF